MTFKNYKILIYGYVVLLIKRGGGLSLNKNMRQLGFHM